MNLAARTIWRGEERRGTEGGEWETHDNYSFIQSIIQSGWHALPLTGRTDKTEWGTAIHGGGG